MRTSELVNASVLVTWILCLAGCTSPQSPSKPQPEPAAAVAPSSVQAAASEGSNAFLERLKKAAAHPSVPLAGADWRPMFDGENLGGWKEINFAGRGELETKHGLLLLSMGQPFTGVVWSNEYPRLNYELALEAMRVIGSDFFCGLTFPVGDTHCTLVIGGWGGSLVGLSSIDGMDASENETTKFMNFENFRWYRVRLRVTSRRIEAWIDDEQLVNLTTEDRRISLRLGEIEMCKPLGLAAWQTGAAYREIKYRQVDEPAARAPRD